MPRKPNRNKNHYNDPFPTRLRQLIDERELKQDDIKGVLGVEARQSVTGYTDGSTAPTADKITAIAKAYNVSADWLLGLTNIRHQSATMQDIERYTGLSPESVELLARPGAPEIRSTLDRLLSSRELPSILERLYDVEKAVLAAERLMNSSRLSGENRNMSLHSHNDRLAFSVFRLTLAATDLCNELYNVSMVEKKLAESREEAADGEHTED